MMTVGMDINLDGGHAAGSGGGAGTGSNDREAVARRIKRGECPNCGRKCYKVGMLNKKKAPLNVPGLIWDGRCLKCHPIDNDEIEDHATTTAQQNNHPVLVPNDDPVLAGAAAAVAEQQAALVAASHNTESVVPRYLNIRENTGGGDGGGGGDDATVVSAITVDREYDPDEYMTPAFHSTGNHNMIPPALFTVREPSSRSLLRNNNDGHSNAGNNSASVSADHQSNNSEFFKRRQQPVDANEIFFQSPVKNEKPKLGGGGNVPGASPLRQTKSDVLPLTGRDQGGGERQEIHVNPLSLWPDLGRGGSLAAAASSSPSRRRRSLTGASHALHGATVVPQPTGTTVTDKVEDLSHLVDNWRYHKGNNDDQSLVDAITRVAKIVWFHGNVAKLSLARMQGVELLTETLVHYAGDGEAVAVQQASVDLLLALAVSTDALPEHDVLVGDRGQCTTDALLIVLQSGVGHDQIQQDGMRVLCCLATATTNNADVNDGSYAGAVSTVLNAMEVSVRQNNRSQAEVQEWGLRTLYELCASSRYARANVRALAAHSGASKILFQALESARAESLQAEWACRLYWCISADEDVLMSFSPAPQLLNEFLQILRKTKRRHTSASFTLLIQSIFGAMANFLKLDSNRKRVDLVETVQLIVDWLSLHRDHLGVNTEAFALLANLAASSSINLDAVTGTGVSIINPIIDAMSIFTNDEELVEEALRALLTLSIASDSMGRELCDPFNLSNVTSQSQQSSTAVQELICLLLSVVFAPEFEHQTGSENDILGTVCDIMTRFQTSERVQEAACTALRTFANRPEFQALLLEESTRNVLLKTSAEFPDSASIQINVCAAIVRLTEYERAQNVKERAVLVAPMIQAVQSHLESADVLEMACAALWLQIYESAEHKQALVDVDGIDAISCVFVMHAGNTAVLEQACGVMASLSSSQEYCQRIIDAGGLGSVLDAVRSEGDSSKRLLQSAALFLKNLVLIVPGCSLDAERVLSTMVAAMKRYKDDLAFQREASAFLWAMASASDACRAKIVSLDGLSVLMNTIDASKDTTDLQKIALGAFNQLTLATGQARKT